MKSTVKQMLAIVAAVALAPAIPTLANAGIIKVTVARDTPYRQPAAPPVASTSSGAKFQIAPVKMETSASNVPSAAPKVLPHPHWR